jgi:hypothetical protein
MCARWHIGVIIMGLAILHDPVHAVQVCQNFAISPTAGLCNGKQLATKGCYEGTIPGAVLDKLKGLADTAAETNCKGFFAYDYCAKVSSKSQVV